MLIENILFFTLGALASGLLALLIIPAIWRRAIRLTKKRIEAATPMSLAEFRADKDQLRAEFALSTRKLEMTIESLRRRLAEQLEELNSKKTDLTQFKTERDQYLAVVREQEEREAELKRRVMELEKEATDLSQRLRMRERDYVAKVTELDLLREKPQGRTELAEINAALSAERQRSARLEDEVKQLSARLEALSKRNAAADAATLAAADEVRTALAKKEATPLKGSELVQAEARIADAGSRLSALLEEAEALERAEADRIREPVADGAPLDVQLDELRAKVEAAEVAILADWTGGRTEQQRLRERLSDIASSVSRVVYAVDSEADGNESLFSKVQRFAANEVEGAGAAPAPARPRGGPGSLSDRLAGLQDLQSS